MPVKLEDAPEEEIRFWRGWKGLYLFVLLYGLLQILLLYLFTLTANQS